METDAGHWELGHIVASLIQQNLEMRHIPLFDVFDVECVIVSCVEIGAGHVVWDCQLNPSVPEWNFSPGWWCNCIVHIEKRDKSTSTTIQVFVFVSSFGFFAFPGTWIVLSA